MISLPIYKHHIAKLSFSFSVSIITKFKGKSYDTSNFLAMFKLSSLEISFGDVIDRP